MSAFTRDPELQRIAEAYALDVVDLVAAQFGQMLDFSDGSITTLEGVLDTLHREAATAKPSDELVERFAKGFGSYLGPWGRVFNRLTQGADESITAYFATLVREAAPDQ